MVYICSFKMARQFKLSFPPSHGGRRQNAGRKPLGDRAGVPHRAREPFHKPRPVLVTLRLERVVWNLRRRRTYGVVREAILRSNRAGRVAITHYSVLGNHLHLIVEAADDHVLTRGMQGFSIRVARALNALMGRSGRVFADRFHSRVLKTAREVRNALAYVLCNARKHKLARDTGRNWVDPYSSAPTFLGWKRRVREIDLPPPIAAPSTWLLRVGWRRHGLLDPAYVPK